MSALEEVGRMVGIGELNHGSAQNTLCLAVQPYVQRVMGTTLHLTLKPPKNYKDRQSGNAESPHLDVVLLLSLDLELRCSLTSL